MNFSFNSDNILIDSEDEWNDWTEEDGYETSYRAVICLFCEKYCKDINHLLSHMNKFHDFDYSQICKKENIDFYQQVNLFINILQNNVRLAIFKKYINNNFSLGEWEYTY